MINESRIAVRVTQERLNYPQAEDLWVSLRKL